MARKKKKQQQEDTGFGPAPIGPVEERGPLTPMDVQQKVFRLAFRGYNEQDVDRFLDQVTEDLAALHEENKRLREALELRGSPAGFDEAKRHAEETVRRAREEAARIVAEAERRVNLAAGMGGSPVPPSFLVRERDFLQQLASLVQRHAETLKEEARRARERQETEPAEPEPEPSPAPEPDPTAPMAVATGEEPAEEGGVGEWSNPFGERQEAAQPWEAEGQDPELGAEGDDPMAEQRSGVPGLATEPDEEEEPSLRELFWGED